MMSTKILRSVVLMFLVTLVTSLQSHVRVSDSKRGRTWSQNTFTRSGTSNTQTTVVANKPQFFCPGAGYFPDPASCTGFYRCVDWSGLGLAFSGFYYKCPAGTIFDDVLDICNHPQLVKGSTNCTLVMPGGTVIVVPGSGSQPGTGGNSGGQEVTGGQPETTTKPGEGEEGSSGGQQVTGGQPETTTKPGEGEEGSSGGQQVTGGQPETTTKPGEGEEGSSGGQEVTGGQPETTTKPGEGEEGSSGGQEVTGGQPETTTKPGEGEEGSSGGQEVTGGQPETTTKPGEGEEGSSGGQQVTGGQPETTTNPGEGEEGSSGGQQVTGGQQETTTIPVDGTQPTGPDGQTGDVFVQETTTLGSNTEPETTLGPIVVEANQTENFVLECNNDNKYRRHPYYCNRYYYCIWNGDDWLFPIFTCPASLLFDEDSQTCAYAEETEACDGTLAPSPTPRPQTNSTTTEEPTTLLPEETTEKEWEVDDTSLYDCPAPGYYPYEGDCIRFYKCIRVDENTLTGLLYRCPAEYGFNEDILRCSKLEDLPPCNRTEHPDIPYIRLASATPVYPKDFAWFFME